ncbi:hypothetical protein CW731_07230 [Polaribacter sp. ALD11]|uniref:InlB B-repeat-containing protein n=1 Tax=Polaribacter sp. ALD11 TaxID=2058137 RepID=UPI000C309182|nr:T9SS type A sorting domain-containing protein [Polaribacter sp. ALD11]AUC85094.1 hypothetical protein CW731_07230 [Polaribacter sp. ALD11]
MKKKILMLSLLISSFMNAQFPTSDILVQYGFDNGSLVTDGVNGNNLTHTGTPFTEVNDRFGNAPTSALQLNGSSLSSNFSFPNTTTDTSLSFWVKTTTNSNDTKIILEKSARASTTAVGWGGLSIRLEEGKIRVEAGYQFTYYNGATSVVKHSILSNAIISDGNWHHLVVSIYNRSDNVGTSKGINNVIKIYVDGTIDSNNTKNNRPRTFQNRQLKVTNGHANGNLFVLGNLRNGAAPNNGRYEDVIDDVLVYKRLLTDAEINSIGDYNNFCKEISNTYLSATNITGTNMDVKISGTQTVDIAYHKASEPFSNATITTGVSGGSTISISSTVAETYNVYIRKNCGTGSFSTWSYPVVFKNLGLPTFVKSDATGNNNGSNWANAYTNLDNAITNTLAGEEIWMAAGTYKPHTSNRTVYYTINKKDLRIYGGFIGTETTRNQRDFIANKTILSGDLQANDVNVTDYANNYANTTRNADNSHHIINVTATGNNLLLDGLIISDAHNNLSGTERGGAIVKEKTVTKLSIKNCIIKNNVSRNDNAGLIAEFELNNTSGDRGTLIIENSQFINNMSRWASGIYSFVRANTNVDITVANSLFDGNLAGDLSSTVKGLGGSASWIRVIDNTSNVSLKLTNNTYVNNLDLGTDQSLNNFSRATVAISKQPGISSTFNATVNNCIFWDNTTVGGAKTRSITDLYKNPLNSLVVNNSIDSYNFNDDSISSKVATATADPLFVSPTDFSLQATSPAINAGNNIYFFGNTDILRNDRIFNTTIDIGAYEYGSPVSTSKILKINSINGSVTSNSNPNPINGAYNDGSVVALTAIPNTGYQFDGWSGNATGTTNPINVTLDEDKIVTANFSQLKHILTVTSTNGVVTSNPFPINGTYIHNTVVTLTATPNAGYQFDGWSGDVSGYTNSINVTMDAVKNIAANFSIICILNTPDTNFKNALLNNATNIDLNNDGQIQCTEANAFSGALTITYRNITDLTGIEAFTKMTKFTVDRNKLTSIDLSNNTALVEIDCSQQAASLTTLILPQTATLTKLVCFNNKLTALDLSNTPNLTEVNCRINQIVSLNTTGLTKLIKLDAQINKITSLDLSTNTSLKELVCNDNELTALDVTYNSSLITLRLYKTLITSLDVSQNPVLTYLFIRNSKLINLNVANGNNSNFTYMGTDGNPDLTCIQIDAGFTPASPIWNKDITANYSTNCNATASISDENRVDFLIQPNPTNGIVNIKIDENIRSIEVYNLRGQKVKSSLSKELNISNLNSGIYFVKITTETNQIGMRKIIKK